MYQRLKLQFYVLLMKGAMDVRNVLNNLAVNKYLNIVESCWISTAQVFIGFPVSISKRSDGSQHSKLPLHASHVALRT